MSTEDSERRKWMATLALADESSLRQAWKGLSESPDYRIVRGPETGLTMVRARSGNTGGRFNLGEMTVTRCSVRLDSGVMGHAWIRGIRPEHARLAALADALLQDPAQADEVRSKIVEPLVRERESRLAERNRQVRPTRVDFFTLARGED